jgi:excisionase family DNA binding protein
MTADVADTMGLPEAAETLGVEYMTLYQAIRRGRVSAFKPRVGARWRIPVEEVERLKWELRGHARNR